MALSVGMGLNTTTKASNTLLKILQLGGRGGGQVVSALAFSSEDPSLNLAEVYNFISKV